VKSCSVLILEDDVEIAESLKRFLDDEKIDVRLYSNAEEALTGFRRSPADVALIDIRLPGLDGIEFLRRLKNDYPLIHTIIITAYPSVENAFTCLASGADDFVAKPFEPEELLKLVKLGCEKVKRWKRVLELE